MHLWRLTHSVHSRHDRHNAELEMGTPALLTAGVNLTHSLDASLGLPPKRVLSQRDVPGIASRTRALSLCCPFSI